MKVYDVCCLFSDDEGFEPGELTEKKGDAWEGEDEDDNELKVWFSLLCFISSIVFETDLCHCHTFVCFEMLY